MTESRKSRLIKLALKLALVFGLMVLLARKGLISVEATGRAFSNWRIMSIAALIVLTTPLLSALRWHWLLGAQGIHLPLIRTFQLAYIGNFFNIALPGAVSGDFVKAFYVGREIKGKKGYAFGSILFDRVAGVSALVLVSGGALLLNINHEMKTPLFSGISMLMLSAAVGTVAFYAYLFLVKEHHDPLLKAFRLVERRFPKADSLTRIYEGVRVYHNHRWTVLKVLAVSVVIHLAVCQACVYFARAMGETSIDAGSVFVVVPMGLLVTAIPVMPAGIGTGHAAFGWLFKFLGSLRGADVFSLFALFQLLNGAIGGLVYLRFRGHEPKPSVEEAIA